MERSYIFFLDEFSFNEYIQKLPKWVTQTTGRSLKLSTNKARFVQSLYFGKNFLKDSAFCNFIPALTHSLLFITLPLNDVLLRSSWQYGVFLSLSHRMVENAGIRRRCFPGLRHLFENLRPVNERVCIKYLCAVIWCETAMHYLTDCELNIFVWNIEALLTNIEMGKLQAAFLQHVGWTISSIVKHRLKLASICSYWLTKDAAYAIWNNIQEKIIFKLRFLHRFALTLRGTYVSATEENTADKQIMLTIVPQDSHLGWTMKDRNRLPTC